MFGGFWILGSSRVLIPWAPSTGFSGWSAKLVDIFYVSMTMVGCGKVLSIDQFSYQGCSISSCRKLEGQFYPILAMSHSQAFYVQPQCPAGT